jgi:hypothetical protein
LTSISRTSLPGKRGADLLLDAFRSHLADEHPVIAPDVVDDRFVELVAADAHRPRVHHAASEITPTSVVPPPMSTTIEPVASATGMSAPIAAAIGSSIR